MKTKSKTEAAKSIAEVEAMVPLTDAMSLRYSGKLQPVEVGHVLTIMGRTKQSAESFDFFLGSDDGTRPDFGDIQFHVSVKFTDQPCITRYSYAKGVGWDNIQEKEENLLAHNNFNPIKRGGDFKISIYVDEAKFYMSIDEKPFCTFTHRKPLADIKRLVVCGDVEHISQVSHSHSKTNEAYMINKAIFSGSVPHLHAETAVVFSGFCNGMPTDPKNEHFVISLIEKLSGKVLIQVISNFEDGVVMAITQDNNQGLHQQLIQKPTPFPFEENGSFKTAIGVTKHDFVVTANGNHFMRVPFKSDESAFLGQAVNFQITTCAGLRLEMTGVDVVAMEIDGTKPVEGSSKTNKLLAQIYHH